MCPEADVAFMEDACLKIAQSKATGSSMKQKIGAIVDALRVTENRAYEFLRGKARRIDGYEKDRAREVLEQIEAENARREEAEHVEWLRTTYQRLREAGEGENSRDVARLEHLLRKLGAFDSALAIPPAPLKEQER